MCTSPSCAGTAQVLRTSAARRPTTAHAEQDAGPLRRNFKGVFSREKQYRRALENAVEIKDATQRRAAVIGRQTIPNQGIKATTCHANSHHGRKKRPRKKAFGSKESNKSKKGNPQRKSPSPANDDLGGQTALIQTHRRQNQRGMQHIIIKHSPHPRAYIGTQRNTKFAGKLRREEWGKKQNGGLIRNG